jgi:negative regulator of replication initiation
MKTFTVKLDEPSEQWLAAQARKLGRTKSDIVRDLIARQRTPKQGRRTLHDIMKDVCGSVKGGPRDLSTNKKHLAGLGE